MSEREAASLDPLRGHSPEVREEDRRIVRLTRFIDLALALIRSGQLPIAACDELVARSREAAEHHFPGSGATFDLIHAPRFRRAISETYAIVH
ncbi:MAG: hypothetical protein U0610_11375 [bacterium]